nr:uncharacterized protein LOC113737406 [Coffea arabica]
MVNTDVHDIVLHCMGRKVRVAKVNPKSYMYSDLLNDVAEKALQEMSGNVNLLVHMRCEIPGTAEYLDVNDDQSVAEMFKSDSFLNRNVVNEHENLRTEKTGRGKNIEVHELKSETEEYICDSTSDDSWNQGWDNNNEDNLGDEHWSVSQSDSSDDDFFDFDDKENEDIVPDSESEHEIDPMREALRAKIAAFKDFVIQKGLPLQRLKNEKSRCTAKCGVDGCKWRIHASPLADSVTYMIKSYTPEHTCVMDSKNREATSDWMAKKLVAVMRDHPDISRKGIEAEMLKYGVHPSKQQVYRAREKAREEIEGTHAASYSKIPKYAVLLRQSNPGSLCKVHYDRPNLLVEPRFLRLFISFKGQKNGFLTDCRPFIGFDGCYLKGNFGGLLLTAVALDANNSIFPIAFAVAESENKETWSWFFYFFQEFFGPFHNSGLNLAYEEQIPLATGRYCCKHICSNFRLQFPGVLLNSLFWKAAKSYDALGFNEAMASIKDMNVEAWRYLSKIPPASWARHAYSTEIKCDHVTNNFTESFNAWVGDLRDKPILTLANGLRKKLMKKLHKRYHKACTWTSNITPKITKKLKEIVGLSRRCSLQMASEEIFEVGDVDREYIVNLTQKACDCGAFQLSDYLASMLH